MFLVAAFFIGFSIGVMLGAYINNPMFR